MHQHNLETSESTKPTNAQNHGPATVPCAAQADVSPGERTSLVFARHRQRLTGAQT